MELHLKIKNLEQAAAGSELGESYVAVWRLGGIRIGAGVSTTNRKEFEYFVELDIGLCSGKGTISSEEVSNISTLIKALEGRGYGISCDHGTITCEKMLEANELDSELSILKEIAEVAGGAIHG